MLSIYIFLYKKGMTAKSQSFQNLLAERVGIEPTMCGP